MERDIFSRLLPTMIITEGANAFTLWLSYYPVSNKILDATSSLLNAFTFCLSHGPVSSKINGVNLKNKEHSTSL